MRSKKKSHSRFATAVIAFAFVATSCMLGGGCSEEETRPSGITVPTALPPSAALAPETLTIGLTDGVCPEPGEPVMKGDCHPEIAWVVVLVTEVMDRFVNQPSQMLAACGRANPVEIADGGSRRDASGGSGSDTWSASLITTPADGGGVSWQLRVDGTEQKLEQFVWMEGGGERDFNSGVWTVYDPESSKKATRRVECFWSRPAGSSISTELRAFPDGYQNGEHYLLAYTEVGDDVTVRLGFPGSNSFPVAWNRKTGAGNFESSDGSRSCCWGIAPSYPNADCADVP